MIYAGLMSDNCSANLTVERILRGASHSDSSARILNWYVHRASTTIPSCPTLFSVVISGRSRFFPLCCQTARQMKQFWVAMQQMLAETGRLEIQCGDRQLPTQRHSAVVYPQWKAHQNQVGCLDVLDKLSLAGQKTRALLRVT